MKLALLPLAALSTFVSPPALDPVASAPTESRALPGPLTVECPSAVVKVFCGESTATTNTGSPQVSGGCPPYTVTYSDTSMVAQNCPAGRFTETIRRTFTITDSCGGSATCVQDIHVLKQRVSLDLHPRSCPNPLNRNANGVYPAAILGSASFDVTQIVPGSLQLWVFECVGGGPAIPIPTMLHVEDVSGPYTGGIECGCTTAGPDGYPDLTFKLNRQSMIQALGLNAYPSMSYVKILVVAELSNGCEILGLDCVRVQN